MKTPESYEKAEIKKFLDSFTCWYFSPFMMGYGKTGIPDIVGCYAGRFFSIEVKREGKVPTPIQDRRISEIKKAGGLAFAGTAAIVIAEFRQEFGV